MSKTKNLIEVGVEGDKYTYIMHLNGSSEIQRYGETWMDVTGNKAICAMAQEIEYLRDELKKAIEGVTRE